MDYITIINTIVGVIGIIVGIIGWKSLYEAKQIKNSAKDISNSTIQQAQIINVNNGLDTYAIIKISKETTQQELEEIVNRITKNEINLLHIEQQIKEKPNIHIGENPPKENSGIWFKIIK